MTNAQLFSAMANGTEITIMGYRGIITNIQRESGASGVGHCWIVTLSGVNGRKGIFVRTVNSIFQN